MSVRCRLPVCLLLLAVACGGAEEKERERKSLAAFDRYRQPEVLVAALDLHPGDAVADVGAGRGYLTHRLATAVGAHGRVLATDVDSAALQQIAAARDNEAPIQTRVVPPADPSLEPAGYDLILLSEVDQLLPDRAAYLRKLTAALRPHGRIAVVNRRVFRGAVVDAAAAAGLHVSGERDKIPAYFIVFLEGPG